MQKTTHYLAIDVEEEAVEVDAVEVDAVEVNAVEVNAVEVDVDVGTVELKRSIFSFKKQRQS